MENGWSREQKPLISELLQGMELAKQLRVQFSTTSSSPETVETLLQRILASFQKALMTLGWSSSIGQPQIEGAMAGVPGSPISVNGSLGTDKFDKGIKDHQGTDDISKKRKILPRWTDHVRVRFETGLEGPHEDGYSWRKYGQKDILGAKYPRSYYRCTFRNSQNCWATKQVQRSDDDPNAFDITYRGTHTCSHATNLVSAPPSPEKQEQKQYNNDNYNEQERPLDMLRDIRSSLRIVTEDLDCREMTYPFSFPSTSFGCMKSENNGISLSALDSNAVLDGFPSPFLSPATPESNNFAVSPFEKSNFGEVHKEHHFESELNKIISANTSTTSSPVLDLDSSLHPVDIEPNFPFDSQPFFS